MFSCPRHFFVSAKYFWSWKIKISSGSIRELYFDKPQLLGALFAFPVNFNPPVVTRNTAGLLLPLARG
jgi:hypothetical protein